MIEVLVHYGWMLLVLVVLMTGVWWVQRRTGNAGWVDVAWSASLGALAVWQALAAPGGLPARWLVGVLGAAWSLRLAWHLARRVVGEAEDGRYRALREHWGARAQRGMFGFFQAQAVVALVFAVPFGAAARNPAPGLTGWMIAGLALWCLAVGGEALADRQLARFRAEPAHRGRTCRAGLWAWSRHPNYFFEWLHWCAYVLIGVGSPVWWLTLVGPVLMLAFLYRVTGIPYTERQALRSRGDDYRRYQREVSAFFPFPPRRRRDE